VYGVAAHDSALRQLEFAMRSVLGASPGNIATLVLLRPVAWAAAGLPIGVLLLWFAIRTVEALWFPIGRPDVTALLVGGAVLLSVVCLGAARPAWRAVCVDATAALRHR
jgi:ABC-type antimicrobial peptide transport system permease subunit